VRFAIAGIFVSVVSQGLEHVLPVPKQLPIDKLFNATTAWPLAIYGVIIAPFFEEFFFRGLIYPSLRRTFAEGMNSQEARAWRPFVWIVAFATVLVSALFIAEKSFTGARVPREMILTLAVALVAGALAGPLLQLLAGLLRVLARLAIPEVFAIAITGILFGLVHSGQLGGAWGPVLILSLVGAAFTAARAYTGSLVASWLMHVAYNSTLFALVFSVTHGFRNFAPLAR
jgi:membrane protease YdiL (CAAX protease family)